LPVFLGPSHKLEDPLFQGVELGQRRQAA
jgi:hypothetical protein